MHLFYRFLPCKTYKDTEYYYSTNMGIMKKMIVFMLIVMVLLSSCISTNNGLLLEKTTEKIHKVNDDVVVKSVEKLYTSPVSKDHTFMRQKETKYTTQSGQKFLVSESSDNHSLVQVTIKAKGFSRNNDYTQSLGEIDPIEDIWHTDLNTDGYSEWFIITRSVGSGAYGELFGYVSDEDTRICLFIIGA